MKPFFPQARRQKATPKFKPCMQHQPMLFPPSVGELIPENALVRVVDSIIEGMDRSALESAYPGGGASAHDPSMMLKVVLFCYASGIYSNRKIAAVLAIKGARVIFGNKKKEIAE